ncbi:MAG: glycosyltransferase [Candidatus Omnitrophota bacterium]
MKSDGLLPPRFFDWKAYLDYYPDLQDAGIRTKKAAIRHWCEYGCEEGRVFFRKGGVTLRGRYRFYAWMTAVLKFLKIGWEILFFDWKYYVEFYPDVRRANIHGFIPVYRHWRRCGRWEDRTFPTGFFLNRLYRWILQKNFDGDTYLSAYTDLLKNGISTEREAFLHWCSHGQREGRTYFSKAAGRKYRSLLSKNVLRASRKRKRILIINHEESRTGAPIMLFKIGMALKNSYDLTVFSLAKGSMSYEFNKEFPDRIYLEALTSMKEEGETREEGLKRILAKMEPDLVYSNTADTIAFARIAREMGIPTLLHIHELLDRERLSLWNLFDPDEVQGAADIFVACSAPVRERLMRDFAVDPSRIELIHSFIAHDEVRAKAEKEKNGWNARIGAGGRRVVMGMGNLSTDFQNYRKGFDLFCEVYKKVREHGRYQFVWIGVYNPEFFSASAAEVVPEILMTGELENPFPVLKKADYFLLTSRIDPFPLVCLEAMALGKPVLAFREGSGIYEALEKGGGIVIDQTEAEDMAQALLRLDRDALLRQRLETQAPQVQRSFFDDRAVMPLVEAVTAKALSLSQEAKRIRFSVILPNFNYERLVPEAIRSVLGQTYRDWELILVDDGSTDGSLRTLKNFASKDPRIKVATHEGGHNRGLTLTLKRGLRESTGEYVAFLEADDVWEPAKLEKMRESVRRSPEAVLHYHDFSVFSDDPQILEKRKDILEGYQMNLKDIPEGPSSFVARLTLKNPILSLSFVTVKRKHLYQVDFINSFDPWFDWWLYLQLSLKGPFCYRPEKLARWRMHERSYNSFFHAQMKASDQTGKTLRGLRDRIRKRFDRLARGAR